MTMRSIVPRMSRWREWMPARRGETEPVMEFRREMERLFDEFLGEFPLSRPWGAPEREEGAFWPRVDVTESDREVTVSAELPGMDEKDLRVELQEGTVIIRGERKEEKEEKGKDWFRREQSYGSFHRVIPLPTNVQEDQAKARFKKGLLTLTVPKKEVEETRRKQITVESE